MENIQTIITSSEKRAKAAILFIYLVTILSIVTTLLTFYSYSLADSTAYIDEDISFLYLYGIYFIAGALIVANIISIVTFIMWFWKGYDNLAKLGSSVGDSKVMTIISWIIPITNFYLPYTHMKKMFDGANDILAADEKIIRIPTSTTIIGIWWALFIVNNFVGTITNWLERTDDSAMVAPVELYLCSIVLSVVLAIVTVRMIKSYIGLEAELIDAFENRNEEINDGN